MDSPPCLQMVRNSGALREAPPTRKPSAAAAAPLTPPASLHPPPKNQAKPQTPNPNPRRGLRALISGFLASARLFFAFTLPP